MMKNKNGFLDTADIAACKKILTDRGPTYKTAIDFFPKWMADRVAVLYAFVRIPDDIVDETPDKTKAVKELAEWKQNWIAACKNPASTTNPILRANAQLFHECDMPKDYWEAFFQAMEWDLTKDRYDTMEELKEYMYGSASVVGLMMLQIMPTDTPYDEATKLEAKRLGYAMQLTNFLRDIAEDWRDRKRIYIPQEIMDTYTVDINDFETESYGEGWKPMIEELIAQCRTWYDQAAPGIRKLPGKLQPAVGVSSVLYSRYLQMIEKSNHRVWHSTYSMSKWKKLRIALLAYLFRKY